MPLRKKTKAPRPAAANKVSEDERTPKRLRSSEPDLTLIVGEEEFYHYSSILCNSCPYFDNMLSSSMREATEKRVTWSDKSPKEWLQVYKFLDPSGNNDPHQPLAAMITTRNALMLAPWFQYLGLDSLVQACDKVKALEYYKYFKSIYRSCTAHISYEEDWCKVRLLALPRTHRIIKEIIKHGVPCIAESLATYCNTNRAFVIDELKRYALDTICGDEIWKHFVSMLDFPAHMLKSMEKNAILSSDLFPYVFELSGRDIDVDSERDKVFLQENNPENYNES
jgi:hypothetical protein